MTSIDPEMGTSKQPKSSEFRRRDLTVTHTSLLELPQLSSACANLMVNRAPQKDEVQRGTFDAKSINSMA